jgi:nucleoside-triphosphatase THEP1
MDKQIIILSGDKGEGKTTAIANYIRHSSHQWGGVLMPILDGKRCMVHLFSQKVIALEPAEDDIKDHIQVGRNTFSRRAFEEMNELVIKDLRYNNNIIIDEIGPMEMNDEGFHPIIREVIDTAENIFLIVRTSLVDDVIAKYRLGRFPMQVIEVQDFV